MGKGQLISPGTPQLAEHGKSRPADASAAGRENPQVAEFNNMSLDMTHRKTPMRWSLGLPVYSRTRAPMSRPASAERQGIKHQRKRDRKRMKSRLRIYVCNPGGPLGASCASRVSFAERLLAFEDMGLTFGRRRLVAPIASVMGAGSGAGGACGTAARRHWMRVRSKPPMETTRCPSGGGVGPSPTQRQPSAAEE